MLLVALRARVKGLGMGWGGFGALSSCPLVLDARPLPFASEWRDSTRSEQNEA